MQVGTGEFEAALGLPLRGYFRPWGCLVARRFADKEMVLVVVHGQTQVMDLPDHGTSPLW